MFKFLTSSLEVTKRKKDKLNTASITFNNGPRTNTIENILHRTMQTPGIKIKHIK